MCTLTWRAAEAGGYDLFFNRDERQNRQPEQPPHEGVTPKGVRYLAPVDGDHGGTWLLLNEHGLTVALLNYYPRGVVETGQASRGALPLLCASYSRVAEVATTLRATSLSPYAPFHLVALDATGAALHGRWDGEQFYEGAATEFLTSSSFEPERVQAARAARFTQWPGRSPEALAEFHRQHDVSAGAESVCMRRPDACTRSVCAVKVRQTSRELHYQPVSWDGNASPMPVTFSL